MALATLEFQDNTRDSIMSPPYWWGAFGDLWEWILLKYQHPLHVLALEEGNSLIWGRVPLLCFGFLIEGLTIPDMLCA